MNIPKEAINVVVGAIPCGWPIPREDHPHAPECTLCRRAAERMLEAAAPFLMAQAWDEGRESGAGEYWDDYTPSNPYREPADD